MTTVFLLRRSALIRIAVALHDMLAAAMAFTLAMQLRGSPVDLNNQILNAVGFAAIAAVVSWFIGLNRGVWRYASIADLQAILITATATVLNYTIAIFILNRLEEIPRSSILLSWVFMVTFLSGPRLAYRMFRNARRRGGGLGSPKRNVLLLGANENSEQFIKAALEKSDLPYVVLGVIDDRNKRVGQSIRGVRVLGSVEQLGAILDGFDRGDLGVDALILTSPSVCAGNVLFDTVAMEANARKVELLRLPDIGNSMHSEARPGESLEPRRIVLTDLLARQPVSLDIAPVKKIISGRRLVVTGAGGSIGSELCRQLFDLGPREVVLIDSSEFALYSIQQELESRGASTIRVVARIGNVRDRNGIMALCNEFRPEIVFHAAALKHVPIVEAQPLEGLQTNVIGTRNVADAAIAVQAQAMVLVSTDKAINPTNVMGASKRMAEIYCQTLDGMSATRFVTVRFGNVLGSAGSVVPLFERQIAAGGPLTVTHPEVERYFMTITEAVTLILQATARGAVHGAEECGRILVLDMGPPVKILDIARKMIRLAGMQPDRDVEIKFIGLRPGEKLYEELFDRREGLVGTEIPGLLIASPFRSPLAQSLGGLIDELEGCVQANQLQAAMGILSLVVTEFRPGEHLSQQLAMTDTVEPLLSGNP